ncbi:FAD/NAD(P)-binding domain-containing protein [Aspergillus brunneoviolaceus CBS 621.78]|uniref:FAD/NAD(P)-binding domain-containing protein n=1 Tax=Aspergillus brunneoviolaceus CBS 621.78 TaxID=1450534 RepID=A0ACD1GI69_9EURO|nr:FAD/NAD(P)-binding domain-containing protein [Aspergillus brunneoviolaceus CBS 621.78]RAH48858.1 FAD/NAD(P)-binding domain-containing protein [Aspergillus brunneoviolaceus CBS 621.78]
MAIEIAIIGSGLIGTLLALGLLNRDSPHLRIQVYEQAACHRELGAGIGFTRAARHCMMRLDPRLDECLRAVATENGEPDDPDYNMRFVDGYHTYVDDDNDQPVGIEGKVYKLYAGPRGFEGCHRAQFLEEIMRLMPEGVVQFGKRLERYEYLESGRIQLVFGDGSVREVDGVIGCDGIKSRVRDLMFPNADHRPRYAHQLAYRGLIPMDQAIAHLGRHRALLQHMHCGPHAHVLHFPVANQKLLNVVAFVPDPNDWDVSSFTGAATTTATPIEETITTTTTTTTTRSKSPSPSPSPSTLTNTPTPNLNPPESKNWTPFLRTLLTLLPPTLTQWPIFDLYNHPPPTYAIFRVCLVGDAAHAASPHHGAGAGVGVEDALALVTALTCAEADILSGKLTTPQALEVAFKAYSDVRYKRSQWVMRSSREVCRAYEWELFEGQEGAGGEVTAETGMMGRVFEEIRRRTMTVWGLDVEGMVGEVQGQYWRGTWGNSCF